MKKKTKKEVEKRKLADLHPHPRQVEFFENLPDFEQKDLADNMDAWGVDQLPDILPANKAGLSPNTILRGHQRVIVLEKKGVIEHDMTIRYDLADSTAEQIEEFFLADNVFRRQLDPLAKVRAAIRIYEIRNQTTLTEMFNQGMDYVRNEIGDLAKMSPRNCSRYIYVLMGPVEIQDALRHRHLSLLQAETLARMPDADQEAVIKAAKKGRSWKKASEKYLRKSDRDYVRISLKTKTIFNGLRRVHDLIEIADEIQWPGMINSLARLESGREALDTLIGLTKEKKAEYENNRGKTPEA